MDSKRILNRYWENLIKNVIRNFGIVINIFALILIMLTIVISGNEKFSFVSLDIINNIIIILQIISIVISPIYENIVKKSIGGQVDVIRPAQETNAIQNARKELRFGLNILTTVSVFCFVYLAVFIESFFPLVTVLALIGIAYLYSDYAPHAIFYAQTYDTCFLEKGEEPYSTRGLARIYLKEYEKTHFNRKDKYYDELNDIRDNSVSDFHDMCTKEILRDYADALQNPSIIYSIVLLFFNILFLNPDSLNSILTQLIGETTDVMEFIRLIFLIGINICFAALNIYSLVVCENNLNQINDICRAINEGVFNEEYKKLNDSRKIKRAIVARGLFEVATHYFTSRDAIESLDLEYRMLYIHKYYTNILRFRITASLALLAIWSILMTFGFTLHQIVMVMLFALIICIILRVFWLPNIGRIRIARECEKLLVMRNLSDDESKLKAPEKGFEKEYTEK